jgi:hypothetical protein
MVRYSRYYSPKKPFMVVSYCWGSMSISELASILGEEDMLGSLIHKGKAVWIDVLCTSQIA